MSIGIIIIYLNTKNFLNIYYMRKRTIKRKRNSNKTKKYKIKQYGGNKIKTIEKNRYGEYEITFENNNYFEGHIANISDQTNINQFTIDGNGLMVYGTGGMYYGDIKHNKREGTGTMEYINNSRFSGTWKDDKPYTGELTKDGIKMKIFLNGKDINERTSKKPITLKSPSYTVQMNETCVAHSVARSFTRTLLVYTLIDGNKSDEMYIALYCFFLNEAIDNKSCTEGATLVNIERFSNKLYENVETLFNYKYGDIPCEFIIGGCLVPDTPINNKYILSFNETEKQEFLKKFNKIKHLLEVKSIPFKINFNENNYPPEEIVDALNKKLQPTFGINISSEEDVDDHQMLLRSWGKEYDENGLEMPVEKTRFCFKNTWINSQNICINDIKEICRELYKNTNINNCDVQFEWLDFDLNEIQKIDNALYLNIIERINSLYNTI